MAKFTKSRFQARLYAYCYTILETRQPDFDKEKIKDQSYVVTILQALEYATEEEKTVITQLTDVLKHKVDIDDEQSTLLGALEGKEVIYRKLNPRVLLEEKDVNETNNSISTPDDKQSNRLKSCLIPLAILILVIIGFRIHNSEYFRERRAYRAITNAQTSFDEKEAVQTYITDFPSGKHSEDVYYRSAKLNANDDFYINTYLVRFPNGEHYAEVKTLYDDCLYQNIARNGNQMTDVMNYLNVLPLGIHAADVNRMCDSIWDSEIAKYHARPKSKKSSKAVNYLEAMLEYMKINRVNELSLSMNAKINLKDYSEYSESSRAFINIVYSTGLLPVKGNVISIKENFTLEDQYSLERILGDGLQRSLDSIFTPGFVHVETGGRDYVIIDNRKISLPKAQFDYEIKSQEDVMGGDRYPHLWTYSENNIPKKYLIGISISFHVVFRLPDSGLTYDFSGKGHPEKDIIGIDDVRDGYRRMTVMSFARFADQMCSSFGLREVYLR